MIMSSNEDDAMFGNAPKKRTGFKITAGKKAFRVLSDKLYKDKAEAVLRELSCNAVDIHCEMGKAHIPFDVTLPTSIYPWFVIRDYGSGLSPEQIDDIFTVYFASTKDESNDSIGGFGLGCKSPFAYSETGGGFTVKSYQNGTCTVYNMYMDDGEPFSTPMSTTATTEADGLEIQVPIPAHEHARWKILAAKVYRAFDRCKPNITNGDIISIQEFPDEEEFFFNDDFGRSGQAFAIIGGVVYPIPERLISSDMVFKYSGRAAYMKFPIGELDIAPSREELSLDKQTEDYLVERMKKFSQSFANTVKKEFEGITDKRDAAIKTKKYNSYVVNAIADLEIGGELIGSIVKRYTDMSKLSEIPVYSYRNGSLKRQFTRSGYSWRTSMIDSQSVFGLERRKVHVLINDTGEGVPNMVKAYHNHINNSIPVVVLDKTHKLKKSEYAAFGKKISAICEKFEPHERHILKFSEMVDIRKAYTIKKRKDAGPKPVKPNVRRVYIDECDLRQVELLCLSTNEIRELEGVGIISYGDTYDRISLKPSGNMNRHAIDSLFAQGVEEVYIIENGKRSAAMKSNLQCGFMWMYEKLMENVEQFDVLDGECPYVNDEDLGTALRLKKFNLFDVEITRVFDKQNDDHLAEIVDWIEGNNPAFQAYHDMKAKIHDINVEYFERFTDAINKIQSKYPLLYAVAMSDIELTPEIMQDIEFIRAR
ncbi:rIIA protector from prophage-induced early lysis [Aeromonas phage 44RR2.8t]|uniref:RIIA protector from prophage-induced early lysis n=2 Tax=Biquartavirus 44RR2 TaxID=115987 RepID=Q6U9V1_9CAUD|nr:RIIA lysis inhibitor [Aeromonas phage 44RR2.8t]AAQ81320.1 rIIA protector from prophage-induced early lysis [Aeromonas phage 44RR2.8t]APU00473.1 rIIA lysis inhibitor [Aeromonas phage 44RR2.8t.2]